MSNHDGNGGEATQPPPAHHDHPKETNNDDTESNASDESFESEADEDEFDRRRAACVADMRELEAQFLKLKEEYIVGKQMLIDQKLKEIEEETAEEFVLPLQKFKQNMDMRLNLTNLTKDYRSKNLDHIYEYEEMSLRQSLQNDKMLLFTKQVTTVEEEIRKLEESRRQFLLDNELASSASPTLLPVGPYIVYSLQDYDILEDISIIKMHMN